MNVDLVAAYLNGEAVQFRHEVDDEWYDVLPYEVPTDVYRLSCEYYQFRLKQVTEEVTEADVLLIAGEVMEDHLFELATRERMVKMNADVLLIAGEVMEDHLFELATRERMVKMNADLKRRLGSNKYEFSVSENGVLVISRMR